MHPTIDWNTIIMAVITTIGTIAIAKINSKANHAHARIEKRKGETAQNAKAIERLQDQSTGPKSAITRELKQTAGGATVARGAGGKPE